MYSARSRLGSLGSIVIYLIALQPPSETHTNKLPGNSCNPCRTTGVLLQHGEMARPDSRTECLCDDGVLLCRDLYASHLDTHKHNPHRYHPPADEPSSPLVNLCKSMPPFTTQWSPCSKTCGLGVSFRVTNNNIECKNQTEAQLCHWKPCSLTPSQRCAPTKRVEQPHTFRLVILANTTRQLTRRMVVNLRLQTSTPSRPTIVCESVRRYRPKYCTPCNSPQERCCVPVLTKTTRVSFRCSDGRLVQHNLEWIRRCACHPDYCKYLQQGDETSPKSTSFADPALL